MQITNQHMSHCIYILLQDLISNVQITNMGLYRSNGLVLQPSVRRLLASTMAIWEHCRGLLRMIPNCDATTIILSREVPEINSCRYYTRHLILRPASRFWLPWTKFKTAGHAYDNQRPKGGHVTLPLRPNTPHLCPVGWLPPAAMPTSHRWGSWRRSYSQEPQLEASFVS